MCNTHDPQFGDRRQLVPTADQPKSPVLEYGTPPSPTSPGVMGWLAVGCAALAWFWLGVLWSEAWWLSVAFGLGGCVAATVGLRSPHLQGWDRAVFVACLLASAIAACGAVLG